MIDPNMKTLGLKDMHPLQIEALMDFVGTALEISAELDSLGENGVEITRSVEAEADQLIRLFGGNGVMVRFEEEEQE